MAEYIEREALIDVLAVSHAHHANSNREAALLDRDIRLVREQPAADVVEVVHGRWDLYGTHYCCSKCLVALRDKVPYCPNCGARMDGDEECGKGKES